MAKGGKQPRITSASLVDEATGERTSYEDMGARPGGRARLFIANQRPETPRHFPKGSGTSEQSRRIIKNIDPTSEMIQRYRKGGK